MKLQTKWDNLIEDNEDVYEDGDWCLEDYLNSEWDK